MTEPTAEQQAARAALAEAEAAVAEADLTATLTAAKDAYRNHPTPSRLEAKRAAVAAVIAHRDTSRQADTRRSGGPIPDGTVAPGSVSNKSTVNKPRNP